MPKLLDTSSNNPVEPKSAEAPDLDTSIHPNPQFSEEREEVKRHGDFLRALDRADFSAEDIDQIDFAYDLAKHAHRPDFRQGGDRYFEHVREVALALVNLRIELLEEGGDLNKAAANLIDYKTIVIALLHDAPEDTSIFGSDRIPGENQREVAAERLAIFFDVKVSDATMSLSKVVAGERYDPDQAKMRTVLQLTKHPRAIFSKISDRHHNIETLCDTPLEMQYRKVEETKRYYSELRSFVSVKFDEAHNIVMRRLADKVDVALAKLEASWDPLEIAALGDIVINKPAKEAAPEIDHEQERFIESLNRFTSSLTSSDRKLIRIAYDLAKYALLELPIRSDGLTQFEHVQNSTESLMARMDEDFADRDAIILSLLEDSVEHSSIFGTDAIEGRSPKKTALFRLEKVFGEDVAKMVVAHTKFRYYDLPLSIEDHKKYANAIASAGDVSILVKINDRLHDIGTAGKLPVEEIERRVRDIEVDFMPHFEKLAGTIGPFQEIAAELVEELRIEVDNRKVA